MTSSYKVADATSQDSDIPPMHAMNSPEQRIQLLSSLIFLTKNVLDKPRNELVQMAASKGVSLTRGQGCVQW